MEEGDIGKEKEGEVLKFHWVGSGSEATTRFCPYPNTATKTITYRKVPSRLACGLKVCTHT